MIARSFAVLLLTAGLSLGQPAAKKDAPKEPPKPAPGSLEDTLEKALRYSADIKAAEAKVRDAEAEVSRIRSQVLTKATTLHTNLRVAKTTLATLETLYAQTKGGVERGIVPLAELHSAQISLDKARGEAEKLEAELKSLRGEFALKGINSIAFSTDGKFLYADSIDQAVRVWDTQTGIAFMDPLGSNTAVSGVLLRSNHAAAVQTPMAERVRKLLNQEVQFDANNIGIGDACKWLLDDAKTDIPFRDLVKGGDEGTITLKGKMPLGAWFQALEDSDPKICIVVRDYGLLMTKKDRMPPSAVSASELWKTKEPTKAPDKK
jgi:hypothetical protein